MHISLLLPLIFHILHFINLANCRCNSFDVITVELETKDGESRYEDVKGCVDPRTVDRNVTRVIVRDENFPSLKYGAVQNLAQVREIEFMTCSIETIEAGAFRNLLRLNEVIITFNNIELIPRGVFSNFEKLKTMRINNNGIKVIEDQAFINLPKLKQLFVFENKIETWRSTWFINSTALEELYFQDNLIHKLPKNAFKNLRNLKRIWLDYNEISTIESGAFRGVKLLDYLGLKYNRLTTIKADIFPNDLSVNTLYVDANRLNYVENDVLKKIKVKVIGLQGNPWKCPCVERIYFWLHQNNATTERNNYCNDKNVPSCVFPEVYSTTCLEHTDEDVNKKFLELVKEQTTNATVFNWERCVRFD